MARRRPRGRRKVQGGGGARAAWIVALALVLGGAGVAAYAVVAYLGGRPNFDDATLCPQDGPPAALAVLLDLTDPLGPAQAARLRTLIDAEVARAPVHAMVSLGVVSADEADWGARFARCKPATGDDASLIYENPALIAERFEAEFQAPLSATIDAMMAGQAQDRSPIMESLQALLAQTPLPGEAGDALTIVVVSDLLQHSDLLSFYRGEGWEAFEASGGTERLARNLGGAGIVLVRVPRPEAGADARALVEPFWSRYLDRQGAAAPLREIVLGDL